jgi:uncharacterized protein YqgC (DUF456 family)
MTTVLYIVGVLLVAAGLVGLLLPAIPGSPLIFAGILAVAWADGFTRIGLVELLILGALTLAISAIDFLGSVVGAKHFGSSRWGMLGAFVGLVAGLPFGLVGIVLGPALGAVFAEVIMVDPDLRRAGKVGLGTLIGLVVGAALKYAVAAVLIGLAAVFWYTR